jgi:hypothetical protein
VSRGPGILQLRILEVLAQEPTGNLPWRWLKNRFPLQVRDKSFYRAIRSLRRMGRIEDYTGYFGGRLPAVPGIKRLSDYQDPREKQSVERCLKIRHSTLTSNPNHGPDRRQRYKLSLRLFPLYKPNSLDFRRGS